MPLFLNPPPQRIRITRDNFEAPERVTLQVDPLVATATPAAVARLQEIFPRLQETRKVEVPAEIRLTPLGSESDSPAILRLEVTAAGIEIAAADPASFLYGAELVGQLATDEGIVGVRIEDWPAFPDRELYVPLPPDALAAAYWERLLENLSRCRFNRLSLATSPGADAALAVAREQGLRLGIEVATRSEPPAGTARLVTPEDSGALRWQRLGELQEAAVAALDAGALAWCVDAGALDAETFLDTLWYGIAFAGACGWNPRKAETRTLRRAFATHFFGPETAPAQEALAGLETALTAADTALPGETAPLAVLFSEDPFAPELLYRKERGAGAAQEVQDQTGSAREALTAAHESAARNQGMLSLLEWPIARLDLQAEHVLALQRARSSYIDAFVSISHPRAATQRLRVAAETLEGLANRVSELEALLVRLWPLERSGEPPQELRARYADRARLLREKAAALHEARNQYIQTGSMAPPEAVGFDRTASQMGRTVLSLRLPPRHSPPWWPEGSSARVRIEARSQTENIPWEVSVDLRALAGEAGAFNIGSACLVRFDDATDTVGPALPLQLTRGGAVFTPEPGETVYYLYLEPRGGESPCALEPAPRSVLRARQSRDGIVLENVFLEARIEREHGTMDRWRARPDAASEGEELLADEAGAGLFRLEETLAGPPPRVRVIENGPLLVRVLAEYEDGRTCRYDLYADMPWCEFATSIPVPEIRHALSPEPWGSGAALLPEPGEAVPLEGAETFGYWSGRTRADGLTFAVLCPDRPAQHRMTAARHDVRGEPHLTQMLVWSGWSDGAARVRALAEALRQPPAVQFGVLEERRAREF